MLQCFTKFFFSGGTFEIVVQLLFSRNVGIHAIYKYVRDYDIQIHGRRRDIQPPRSVLYYVVNILPARHAYEYTRII